jgi:hypothetical protein
MGPRKIDSHTRLGINGPKNELMLKLRGVFHFVKSTTRASTRYLDERKGFKRR